MTFLIFVSCKQGTSASKVICSILLFRQSVLKLLRGKFDSPRPNQIAQLMALWFVPWKRISSPLLRAIFVIWLQLFGQLIPELAVFTFVAGNLSKFVDRHYGVWASLLPPFISGSITFAMHEAPWLILPSYLQLLRAVSGASRPVLTWETSALNASDPAGSTQKQPHHECDDTPSASVSTSELFNFWSRGFAYALKLFAVGYLIIKPLIRRRLPDVSTALLAVLRSATWVSAAGFVVLMCGWIQIPNRPWLTSLVRVLFSGVSSMMVNVEGPEELAAIKAFMLGQALLVLANSLQRFMWHTTNSLNSKRDSSRVGFAESNSNTVASTVHALSNVPRLISTILPALQILQSKRANKLRSKLNQLSDVFLSKSVVVTLIENSTSK
jgi:hypothetical protein